jgi:phospholipid-translocating ATPase
MFSLTAAPSTKPRTIQFNESASKRKKSPHPANIVKNQKYNVFTFLPLVLYEQFKFFYNLYFLLVALSQFIPALRIGASTYIPLSLFTFSLIRSRTCRDPRV